MRTFGTGAIWTFTALYLDNVLKMQLVLIGIIFALNAILGGIIQIYSGYLGDKYGFKRVVVIFSFGSVVTLLLLFFTTKFVSIPYIFVLLFLVNNIMSSIFQPSTNALLSLSSDTPLSGFSSLRVATNLGWALGPALGGVIVSIWGFPFLYLIAASASVVAFVLYLLLIDVKPSQIIKRERLIVNDRNMLFFGISIIFLFVVVSQFSVTFSIYANKFIDMGLESIGFVYFINGIVVVLFQWPVYLLVKKMGMWNGMLTGTLLYVIGYFSMAIDHSLLQFFTSMFIVTMGENFVTPTGNALVSKISGGRRLGSYMGLYNFFTSFGRAMGPAYGSLLLSTFKDPYYIWGLAVIPGGIAIMIFIFLKFYLKNYK
ncbi:MAG: MFS transporter [Thermoplasmata archaeon]